MNARTVEDIGDADDAERFRWLVMSQAKVSWTRRAGETHDHCEIEAKQVWTRRKSLTAAVDSAMRSEIDE